MIKVVLLFSLIELMKLGGNGDVLDFRDVEFTGFTFDQIKPANKIFFLGERLPKNVNVADRYVDPKSHLSVTSIDEFDVANVRVDAKIEATLLPSYNVPNSVCLSPFGNFDLNPHCWRLARVVDGKPNIKPDLMAKFVIFQNLPNDNFAIIHGKVRPNLSLTNVTSVLGHFLGREQGPPNVIHTKGSNERHHHGGDQHPKRPPGHVPLSIQILLGSLMLIGGLYHANDAFRLGDTVKPGTGAVYLVLSMAGIGIGIGLLLSGLLP